MELNRNLRLKLLCLQQKCWKIVFDYSQLQIHLLIALIFFQLHKEFLLVQFYFSEYRNLYMMNKGLLQWLVTYICYYTEDKIEA